MARQSDRRRQHDHPHQDPHRHPRQDHRPHPGTPRRAGGRGRGAHPRPPRGPPPVFAHDVIIHGVRVRATTDSSHLHDFWVDNWYSPEEWRTITGMTPPAEPQVTVYAMGQVPDQEGAADYSRRSTTITFFHP